ncbi:MAG TPA: tyrosine-type recombinase/integrase [Nocardioidaceae bacterium]|nr:tyrosine-type recombinase/integrase [Nocardioidaceae bacterium]
MRELAERWLNSRHDIRPVTVVGYRSQLAPVLRKIGDVKVQALTVADMDALVTHLATQGGVRGQALSARSIRAGLVAIGQVLDVAVRDGMIVRNPARLAKRPRSRRLAGTDLKHWQAEQLRTFVNVADTDYNAAAWRLTASGMTRADVLGLRWSDIDLDNGVVSISQGRVAVYTSDAVDDPKSQARRRSLPVEQMWPGTIALLRSLRASQAAQRLAAGTAWQDSGYVVVDALGKPVRPEWYSDRFRVVSRSAGLPDITLHSVRHSLAFWLHSIGVTPADASAMLGHTVEVHLAAYLPHSGTSGIGTAARALGASVG